MKNDDSSMRVHERRKVRSTICTLKCRLWAPTVDGRGMVSLATRQTPQIDDNTPARGGITMYNGVWRVAKLTIPRPSTIGAHSLHFNVHIVDRTFLRSWTRILLSSFSIVFQSVEPEGAKAQFVDLYGAG